MRLNVIKPVFVGTFVVGTLIFTPLAVADGSKGGFKASYEKTRGRSDGHSQSSSRQGFKPLPGVPSTGIVIGGGTIRSGDDWRYRHRHDHNDDYDHHHDHDDDHHHHRHDHDHDRWHDDHGHDHKGHHHKDKYKYRYRMYDE
jgi:hypothetical protein